MTTEALKGHTLALPGDAKYKRVFEVYHELASSIPPDFDCSEVTGLGFMLVTEAYRQFPDRKQALESYDVMVAHYRKQIEKAGLHG